MLSAMDPVAYVTDKAQRAKASLPKLAGASAATKNRALAATAEQLAAQAGALLAANREDVSAAERHGLSRAMIDRLTLTPERIRNMAAGVQAVAALPDPVGEITRVWRRPNGIEVGRMRVPIGLIGIVYESRPNVTADAAALCLKSGNTVILRGGSEALSTNTAIARILGQALAEAGLPSEAVAFVDNADRALVAAMLKLDRIIDLIIPRGGHELIRTVVETSSIPVIKHDAGVCHTYVDARADLAMAESVCFNAKVQRPATCNAMETMLVHRDVAAAFLPRIGDELRRAGVELRACSRALPHLPGAREASETDWHTEYNDLVLNVRVVDDYAAAIAHIATYGTQHTEAIITTDYGLARRFLREVDAAVVMVNASTRLNDGYELGLGAEIGISTTRIHARGPMGLEELTSTKFIVLGDGQLRQ
jgi:glutamate-5-semialdehyde dehydrogenase